MVALTLVPRPPGHMPPGGVAVSLAAGPKEAGNAGLFCEKRDRQAPRFGGGLASWHGGVASRPAQGISTALRSSSPCRSEVSAQLKLQQPARNLPVKERHLLLWLQADRVGEVAVAGKHVRRPAGAALRENFAQKFVQPAQLLFLADALAVGRVTHDHARQALRRLEVAHVPFVEAQ